jgi:hypothetical protein
LRVWSQNSAVKNISAGAIRLSGGTFIFPQVHRFIRHADDFGVRVVQLTEAAGN